MSLSKVSSLTFNTGENNTRAVALDTANGIAYYTLGTTPAVVVKVDIATNTRLAALTLGTGENDARNIYLDLTNGFGYICCSTSPSVIVKIKLSDFTRVGGLTLSTGENTVVSGALDIANDCSYWGDNSVPAKIIKVNNNGTLTPTRVGNITLSTGEDSARGLVINAGFLYVATYTIAARVVKVDLSTFTRTGAITFNTGENYGYATAVDAANSNLYVSCLTAPSIIVKVNLSTFTRTSALTISGNATQALLFDSARSFLYAVNNSTPSSITTIETVGFTESSHLAFDTGENSAQSGAFDTTRSKVLAAMYLTPGRSIVYLESVMVVAKQSLVLTTYPAAFGINVAKQSLVLTTYPATFGINVAKQSLVLTTYPAAGFGINVAKQSLVLTPRAATVSIVTTTLENFGVTAYNSTGVKQTGQTVYMEAHNSSNEQYNFTSKAWVTPGGYTLSLAEYGVARPGFYESQADVSVWDGEVDVHIWYVSTETGKTVNYDFAFDYVSGVRKTDGLTSEEHNQLMNMPTLVWAKTLPL